MGDHGEARDSRALVRRVALAGASAMVAIAVVVLVAGAPVAWLLLGLTGVLALSGLVVLFAEGRFFEPLTVILGVALVSFVMRPLQLFANAPSLASYFEPEPGVESLFRLDNQEVAFFVTELLTGPLEPALTRAIAAVTLFVALVLVGYALPLGRRAARRLARAGTASGRISARPLIVTCLTIGALGQAAVVATVGGPADIAGSALEFKVYKSSVWLQLLMGFGVAGLLVWAAWMRPTSTRSRVLFAAVLLEICLFYAITGSRTRVFLTLLLMAVVSHEIWRRWRLRTVLVGGLLVVVVASSVLAVRQATTTKPVGEALLSAHAYLVDPRGILNDFTEFDALFMATSAIGTPDGVAPYQYGNGIVRAFRSYVPRSLDPNKPESGDQEFRELIFGERFGAGRPYTIVGDLWNDFGFVGVAIGALLFGLLARALAGLAAAPAAPGREYRAALYAVAVVMVYVEATVTYSVTLGYILSIAVPFLVAIHVIAPVTRRAGGIAVRPARPRAPALPPERIEPSSE